MTQIGKILIILGIILLVIGVLYQWHDKMPWLGKLPGDIHIRKQNFTIHIPIVTCIVISIVLSFIVMLINRIK